ncbi:PREDICTED: uncharacterized protein LOC109126896 [Camelina sativa]|uniref:Uncharacterized protein LOC109126896 n=1 Tax=Camelina sativa TaxID=90675 RepID=A0ABM1QHV5_CAMSA|nr:PREDICTED: uncharacterized protein LOC109126896 [Camelina sativa]
MVPPITNQKLNSIQQGSLDVTSYYTLLVTLWEEYKNSVELPVCTCRKCECNAAALWEKLQERGRVTKFLMGLNASYEATRRHILMLKPIPSIEEAFNMVTSDERQKTILPKPDSMIFQTSAPAPAPAQDNVAYAAIQNSYRPRGSRPICTHCGHTGHVIQKCFKLHGYPPGYIPGFKSTFANYPGSHRPSAPAAQSRGQSSITPHPQTHAVANVVTEQIPSYSQSTPANTANFDVSTLTGDQIQSLLQQLNAQVKTSEGPVSSSQASSITEHGAMAIQSTSGNTFSFPSSSLRFENDCLTFQHQCLSSLSKHIPHGSWIIDTGATSHVYSDLAFFSETVTVLGVTVSLPNEAKVDIKHCGTVKLTNTLILHNVLHVPSFTFNLISISCLLQHNHGSAHFFPDHCYLQESIQGLMIGRGFLLHNLYVLQHDSSSVSITPSSSSASASPSASTHFTGSLEVDGHLWHQRLGYPSHDKLKLLTGILPSSDLRHVTPCDVCLLAKQKRLPYISNNHLSPFPFDLVHLDIWGPFSIESVEGFRYFLTIVDDCTRATWVYLLRNKSDVTSIFPAFIQYVFTQYKKKIKKIRTDNAPELASTDLVKTHGMIHQFSCAYTPQQNSIVERKHQHLLNVTRALFFQSHVPLAYWTDCLLTAVFLINITPSPLMLNRTPYELLNVKKPDYTFLRTFGCLCYVSTNSKDRHKFSSRADKCVFLGYSFGYKGYKVLHLDSNVVSISRNFVFHETIFPFVETRLNTSVHDPFDMSILPLDIPHNIDYFHHPVPHTSSTSHASTSDASHNTTNSNPTGAPSVVGTVPAETTIVSPSNVRPRRSSRELVYLSDYHCSLNQISSSSSLSTLSTSPKKLTTPYPLSSYLSDSNLKPSYKSYILSVTRETEPKIFKEAIASLKWT